jgi:hypothetical protein
MAEDSIVLEHLRHIRGAVDGLRDDMREVKGHIGALENHCATLSNCLDHMAATADRIERRLDLIGA